MGEQAQETSDLTLSEPVDTAVQQNGAKLRVFICYSRIDVAFAEQLASALNPWFACQMDHHSIGGGEEWEKRLGNLISDADTIIFVLSPDSAGSKICAWEVDEAVRLNKRIIPINCRPLEGTNPPSKLQALQQIHFYPDPKTPGSGFGNGLARLVVTLNTDFDWVREHTRYFQRATEWDARGRPANRLLSGDHIVEARAWAERRPKNAPEPMALHLDFIRASEQEAEARSSEQRKQLETITAAQAEREEALREREEALKQVADAQRKRARNRNALVAVSVLAVVAGSFGWGAEQSRKIAVQSLDILARATKVVAQDKDDPAKVREWLEWAAAKGSVEAKTALRSLDEGPAKVRRDDPPDAVRVPENFACTGDTKAEADPQDYKPPASSEKATAKGNKARFKPLSTASRATFWRWWGSHLAIEAKVSPASHRAIASVRW
jgi:hypothetical protein